MTFIEDDAADAMAGLDEFEKDGNDGLFFAGSQPIEEGGADCVDAGKEVGALMAGAEHVANIEEQAGSGIKSDVRGGAGRAQGQSDEVA